jgi:hypothetical protein
MYSKPPGELVALALQDAKKDTKAPSARPLE